MQFYMCGTRLCLKKVNLYIVVCQNFLTKSRFSISCESNQYQIAHRLNQIALRLNLTVDIIQMVIESNRNLILPITTFQLLD